MRGWLGRIAHRDRGVRYFTEQRQMLRDGKLARPAFKCGPPENARSWQALVTEFFGGRDLVPAC